MKNLILQLSFFILSFAALSTKAQTVSPLSGSNFDITGSKAQDTFDVILKFDGGGTAPTFQLVGANPAFVKYNNSTSDDYKKAFAIRFDPVLAELVIKVELSAIPNPGLYEVQIPYYFSSSPLANNAPGRKINYFSVNVNRPPAVIESLNTLTIINDDNGTIKGGNLALRETGHKSSISDLSFETPNIPHLQKNQKLIIIPDSFKKIGSGEALPVPYSVSPALADSLPLGKTTFTLYVNSGMTTAPLPISFEFNKNLWKGYIFLTVFIGLLFGFAVRHILQSKIDNTAAKLSGETLLNDIRLFKGTTKDSSYLSKLEGFEEDVRKATNEIGSIFNSDPTASVAIIKNFQTKFDQLRQDFKDSLQASIIILMNAKVALSDPSLPEVLQPYLEETDKSMDAVNKAIIANNPTEAALGINALSTQFGLGITDYKNYLTSIFSFLVSASNLPNDTITTQTWIPTQNVNFQGLCNSIAVVNNDYKTAIINFRRTQKEIEAFPDQLRSHIIVDFGIKNDTAATNPAVIQTLDNWLSVLKRITTNDLNKKDAIEYAPETAEKLNILKAIWARAISNSPVTEDTGRRGLENDEVLNMVRNVVEAEGKDKKYSVFSFDVITEHTDLEKAISRTKNRYLIFNLLQLVLLTILIGLGAYNSYSAAFIGTPDQFITLFIVAFTLDITIGNVGQFKSKSTF